MRKTFLAVVVLTFAMQAPAVSDENDAKSTPAAIKGTVIKVDIALNDLRDARLSISRARKAAANLFDEVTRQQMTMTYNPNIIGTTVITVPMPQFTGAYLPARPKWVKASMDEIGPIVTLLKEDVDAAIESNRRADVSNRGQSSLAPLREGVFSSVKSSFDIYQQLQQLTAGSNYENQEIANTVKKLDENFKQIDKDLKKGIAILQKEERAAKKRVQA